MTTAPLSQLLTLVFVMFEMVALESDGCGQPNDDVPEHAEEAVGHWTRVTKGEVVPDLVNSERHRVIDRTAKDVGREDDERPRERGHGVSRDHLR